MTQQIEQGKALFDLTCSSCHGLGGEGTSQGPTLIGVGAASVDFQMGTGRMPATRREAQLPARTVNYSQEQIDAVAAYVATFGPAPPSPRTARSTRGSLRGGTRPRWRTVPLQLLRLPRHRGRRGAMPNGEFAPSIADTQPRHIYAAMRSGPQQMPTFSKAVITDEDAREIIGYVKAANGQPNHGGLSMGDAGPSPRASGSSSSASAASR
ncbi:cytochrome bc1 complex diheme cytochrome c subunit [Tessaracoccus coleopterorum]